MHSQLLAKEEGMRNILITPDVEDFSLQIPKLYTVDPIQRLFHPNQVPEAVIYPMNAPMKSTIEHP